MEAFERFNAFAKDSGVKPADLLRELVESVSNPESPFSKYIDPAIARTIERDLVETISKANKALEGSSFFESSVIGEVQVGQGRPLPSTLTETSPNHTLETRPKIGKARAAPGKPVRYKRKA